MLLLAIQIMTMVEVQKERGDQDEDCGEYGGGARADAIRWCKDFVASRSDNR